MKHGKEKNKVLMITYAFPPVAFVGVYRTLKYSKYLHQYGWTPLILTSKSKRKYYRNEELCRQIPNHVKVFRTIDIDPGKWLAYLSRFKRDSSSALLNNKSTLNCTSQSTPGIWNKFKDFVRAVLTDCPDSHIFWVPVAFLKGFQILVKEKIDVVYSTSPPHSSHIVAYLLAKCFNKPYVLDFRDPWFVNGSIRPPSSKHPWLLKMETKIKRILIKNAARIISVSKGERDELRQEFTELNVEHFDFITNGYDLQDFSALNATNKLSSKLILAHIGLIYSGIAGEFFEALQLLIKEHQGVENRIQVNLVGGVASEYRETINQLETAGIVKTFGQQPHATALRMMFESDVLLILLGGDRFLSSHIPAKIFEYLYIGKPILAIAKDGDLAEIIQKSGLGILVYPDSVETIAHSLWEIFEDYEANRLVKIPNNSYIQSFDRSILTEKFANTLNEVKGKSGLYT